MSLGDWPATPLNQAHCFEGCGQDRKAKVYVLDAEVCMRLARVCMCVVQPGGRSGQTKSTIMGSGRAV